MSKKRTQTDDYRKTMTAFYASKIWLDCRDAYRKKQRFICERCGAIAPDPSVVHHIKPLNPENINNPEIALNHDNLMFLCQKCHNQIHYKQSRGQRYITDKDGHVIYTTDTY